MTAAHEPRRAPRAHLSAEELSDVVEARQEGALDGVEPTQDVLEHLEGCAQCQADVGAMAELLDTLGRLEQPPIPANVALRIDAALAEAARTSETPGVPAAATESAVTRTADTPTSSSEHQLAGSEHGSAALPGDEDSAGSRSSSEGSPASRSHRRPPSLGADKRHPESQRPGSRRSLRRTLSWTLGSLVVLGGAAGLATALFSSSSGGAASGSSVTAARGSASFSPLNPQAMRNNGDSSGGTADTLATLASWTKSALAAAPSPTPVGSGASGHPHALVTAPDSAAAAAIAQCLTNPAEQGRQVLASSYGNFLGKPAVLIVYAIGDGSQSVDAVAYQAPCASTDYLVLAEGTVPK